MVAKIGAIIDTNIEVKYQRGTFEGSMSSAIKEIARIKIAIAVNTKVNKEARYSSHSHRTPYIMNWMRNSSIGRILGIKEKSSSSEKFLYLSRRLRVTIIE